MNAGKIIAQSQAVLPRSASQTKERRRGRPKADAKESVDEAQLLRTAFATFASRGYDASTMRGMARDLKVSHNLLNVRFGRQSELWKAAVEWRLREASRDVEPAFTAQGSPEERLRDLVHRFCRWAVVNSDVVAISYREGQQESWRLDYLIAHFVQPFQIRLQELLQTVAQVHPFPAPISSGALLALLVHGVGSFFALDALHARLLSGLDAEAAGDEAQVHAMAEFLLAGLLGGNRAACGADRPVAGASSRHPDQG